MKPFEEVYKCDSITLNLTNACNLSCIYCFEHNKYNSYMDAKTAIDIVDKAYRPLELENASFTVNLFGGEPMLNWPVIKAVIDDCNKKHRDIYWGMTTNLTQFPDDFIKYVDEAPINLLVSIDGIKAVHDKNRCNTWDTVTRNLKKLITAGLSLYLEPRMTVMPEDAKYMFEGVDYLVNELQIDNVTPMPVTDKEWTEEQLNDYKENYEKIMDMYISHLNNDNSKRNISIKNIDDILVDVLSPDVSDDMYCPIFSNKWCTFDTNGDIYPCHQIPTSDIDIKKSQKIGNIYTGVDESKVYDSNKEHRKATYYKEECKTCPARVLCKGGCPEENIRETGIINKPTDAYCSIKRIMSSIVKKKQNEILNASNIRSRKLNVLKNNIEIKNYVDKIYNDTKLTDTLSMSLRLMHLNEMIQNLGEDALLPSFDQYIKHRLEYVLAGSMAINNKEEL